LAEQAAQKKNRVEELKGSLRTSAMAGRGSLSAGYRAEAARAAADHLFAEAPFSRGQTIACYWPIRDEMDCKPVLTKLMDDSWRVCLPVVGAAGSPLTFRLWEAGQPLYPAGFGTLEPADTAPLATPDVVLMPLLGFDRTGTRLGYGGGYYDRTLEQLKRRPKIVGYAFSAQEISDIPREPHDVPLDILVTENGVIRFSA
jgi:5-formyltetrahydrofolate cyclo-ligase